MKKGTNKEHKKNPTSDQVSDFFVGNNQRQITSKFGAAVKSRRERLNISQTELAKLASLNRSYLSELEHGLVSISLERAEKIAKALGCSLLDLLK